MSYRGVLLVNLGSPESTSVRDVRAYLRQFLMDPCVIDIPRPLRSLIVKGFILPFRPKHSAKAYGSIWWDEGSPLIVISKRVQTLLQEKLEEPVALGMRYGKPSIGHAIDELYRKGIREVLLIPLYPQHAMATVETVVDETRTAVEKNHPEMNLDVFPPFFDDSTYIGALVASTASYLSKDYDHLLLSYHGIPERHVKKADPTSAHCLLTDRCCETNSIAHRTCYRHQVIQSARAFAAQAGVPADRYSVAFQSRIGMDAWLKPATSEELVRLATSGVKRLVVMCPAFVSDCLETLEEIGIRGRESFLEAGGESLTLIPCLNDHEAWIGTLLGFCTRAGFAVPRSAART